MVCKLCSDGYKWEISSERYKLRNERKEQEECRKHAGLKLQIGRFKLPEGGALYDIAIGSYFIR
ncbi:MAG TPA: hypothetical protein QF468_06285 [Nitrospinota bacterium]|jgi:hypothetical protein|nr:hypothetical protein [Nitrospinota bacterium]|tara:strand:- start:449 stop:640 length:192 start_codon:yes stop_codon:yes gene_type:complete